MTLISSRETLGDFRYNLGKKLTPELKKELLGPKVREPAKWSTIFGRGGVGIHSDVMGVTNT